MPQLSQAGASTPAGAVPPPVVPPVLREHLEELAFLAIQRRKLLFAPDVPWVSFPSHDERIAAHWDGLAVGGQPAVQLALDGMDAFDEWETAAAPRVWMSWPFRSPLPAMWRRE